MIMMMMSERSNDYYALASYYLLELFIIIAINRFPIFYKQERYRERSENFGNKRRGAGRAGRQHQAARAIIIRQHAAF